MIKILDIIKYDLCVGCGLCAAISNSKMILDKTGFYKPDLEKIDNKSQHEIVEICPGIKVRNDKNENSSVWGKVELVSNAWAKDVNIRRSSSSGGVTSAIAIYLLETHKVDAVLHVGVDESNYLYNRLYISRTRDEILKRNASRYAPAAVLDSIVKILDSSTDVFAFIGKPCDIAGVKNLLKKRQQYEGRVNYFLAIFCAGMPNYNATLKAISVFGREKKTVSLRYRGDGWPGYFTVIYEDGTSDRMTYNDSWGKILGRSLGFRCKICPDGIGLLADIASGDAWNTKDGYPDFTESDGRNFCFIRTKKGMSIFEGAHKAGYVEMEKLHIRDVKNMQYYQYERRHYVGWRILIVQLMSNRILQFKRLGYLNMALKANLSRAICEMYGTMKRFYKIRIHNGER